MRIQEHFKEAEFSLTEKHRCVPDATEAHQARFHNFVFIRA